MIESLHWIDVADFLNKYWKNTPHQQGIFIMVKCKTEKCKKKSDN